MSVQEEAHPLPDHLLLFDGVCNLCNALVRFVIRRDRRGRFRFATLQSAAAHQLLGREASTSSTFIYWRKGRPLERSTAALNVARDLSGAWPMAYAFMVVPRFLRDPVYDLVARKRYRWFGKRATCMVPTPEISARFLP
ncbi:MAG TPA: DCC1-like thiol-disulfide oxidoreductase family protein [Flavobacteriales bacterium]|nr:DCC1-like thiol-disulfide oxidoreductase family protein [Flavobacteriales bacterium]